MKPSILSKCKNCYDHHSVQLVCVVTQHKTKLHSQQMRNSDSDGAEIMKMLKILTALTNFTKLSCKPKDVSIRNMCVQKFSFLAFTDSKCPQWTEKNMTKSENFRDFWVKRQVFSTKISKKTVLLHLQITKNCLDEGKFEFQKHFLCFFM